MKVTDFWNEKVVVLVNFLASGDNSELTTILTFQEKFECSPSLSSSQTKHV